MIAQGTRLVSLPPTRTRRGAIPILIAALLLLHEGGCSKRSGIVAPFDAVEENLREILGRTAPVLAARDAAELRGRRDELINLRLRAEKLEIRPETRVLREELLRALDAVIDGVDAALRSAEENAPAVSGMDRCSECLEKAAEALSRLHEERARISGDR